MHCIFLPVSECTTTTSTHIHTTNIASTNNNNNINNQLVHMPTFFKITFVIIHQLPNAKNIITTLKLLPQSIHDWDNVGKNFIHTNDLIVFELTWGFYANFQFGLHHVAHWSLVRVSTISSANASRFSCQFMGLH